MTKTRQTKATKAIPTVYSNPLPRCTAEMAGNRIREHLTRELDATRRSSISIMEAFTKRAATDPAGAFEWSSNAFDAAASLKVADQIDELVRNLEDRGDEYTRYSSLQIMRIVTKELDRSVKRYTRSPARSTSMQSNLIEQSIAAAQAKLLDTLERGFEFSEVAL